MIVGYRPTKIGENLDAIGRVILAPGSSVLTLYSPGGLSFKLFLIRKINRCFIAFLCLN